MVKFFPLTYIFLWGLSILAFGTVIGAHIYFSFRTHPKNSQICLDSLIPKNLPGWKFEIIELGETPRATARAKNILKCSDNYSCRYKFGQQYLNVYISYWAAGIISPREVASHTPNICWVLNGWSLTQYPKVSIRYIQDKTLKPYESHLYTKSEYCEHVIFWHLVEDQIYSFGSTPVGDGRRLWQDIKTYGLNPYKEQYFIRLSSNLPWKTLENNPNFEQLLQALGPLGIFEEPISLSAI